MCDNPEKASHYYINIWPGIGALYTSRHLVKLEVNVVRYFKGQSVLRSLKVDKPMKCNVARCSKQVNPKGATSRKLCVKGQTTGSWVVQSDNNLPTFHMCLLPPPSEPNKCYLPYD